MKYRENFLSCYFKQIVIKKSDIPEDKMKNIVNRVNEALDKFTIEKVIILYFLANNKFQL